MWFLAHFTVFTRSFSVLVLNPILTVHEEKPFLKDHQLEYFRERMLDYINREQDFRGYHPEHGWAHAFAHWSDCTYFLTYGLEDPKPVMHKTLQMIQDKYIDASIPLSREEDERLTTNIIYTYVDEKMISPDEYITWINGFNRVLEIEDRTQKYTAAVNVKNLLRSMYFRMKHLKIADEFVEPVFEMEKKFNYYYY